MFAILPIGDVQKTRYTAWINWMLIAANVIVFVWSRVHVRPGDEEQFISLYALVPKSFESNPLSLFTSMFLHADLIHLGGNMLFLYIAGDNVEDRLGHLAYLFFYVAAGLVGSAVHIAYTLHFGDAGMPTIGASGAISGVMGAFLVFCPRTQIKFLVWIVIFVRFFTLPAWGVLGFWVASQVIMARNQFHGVSKNEAAMVAVFAHLGGFAFGFIVAALVRMFGKAPKRKSD